MEKKHPVVALIESMYNARDLIAALYDSEDEVIIDENKKSVSSQLGQLLNLQLLIPVSENTYYLDSDFSRLIDKGLRQDTISYLNSDIGAEINKIQHVFEAYKEAVINVKTASIPRYRKELNKLFIAITQRFNNTADELFNRAQLSYGKQEYGNERILENQYYQDELERLKKSYYEVTLFLEAEQFRADPMMSDLTIILKGRTMGFFDKATRTLKLLKEFSYRVREQEIRTEKLRTLNSYLKSNPTERFDNTMQKASECDSLCMSSPLKITTNIDHDNSEFFDLYAHILSQLKVKPSSEERYQRQRSSCSDVDLDKVKRRTTLSEKLFLIFLEQTLTSKKAQFARNALNSFSEADEIDPQFWIYKLLNALQTNRRIDGIRLRAKFQYKIITKKDEGYSGNVIIQDIILAPKSIDNEKMNALYQGYSTNA
jgi:hypothetical protein